jgi:hypothetical protein
MGEWRHSYTILDLGTRWRWVVSFTRRPLYPRGKSPRYSLDRRLGGPQSRSERYGEEKNPGSAEPLDLGMWNFIWRRIITQAMVGIFDLLWRIVTQTECVLVKVINTDKKVITELYSYWVFGLRPSSGILRNTTFRKLDLFPSSSEGVGDTWGR